MTHGHELMGDMLDGMGERVKGEKKEWDNCNSKINKIYFKKAAAAWKTQIP